MATLGWISGHGTSPLLLFYWNCKIRTRRFDASVTEDRIHAVLDLFKSPKHALPTRLLQVQARWPLLHQCGAPLPRYRGPGAEARPPRLRGLRHCLAPWSLDMSRSCMAMRGRMDARQSVASASSPARWQFSQDSASGEWLQILGRCLNRLKMMKFIMQRIRVAIRVAWRLSCSQTEYATSRWTGPASSRRMPSSSHRFGIFSRV
jgi:hypothetical protein